MLANVTGRIKEKDSLKKCLYEFGPSKGYKKEGDFWTHRRDIVGLRIAVYFPGQEPDVIPIIQGAFEEEVRHRKEKGSWPTPQIETYRKRFGGYDENHYWFKLCPEDKMMWASTVKEFSRFNFAPSLWIPGIPSFTIWNTKPWMCKI